MSNQERKTESMFEDLLALGVINKKKSRL